MKILVTGGAGFIGSHIVDRLINLGHRVVVLDDFSTGREENLARHRDNRGLIVYQKSVCDDLGALFETERPAAVLHLAALARVQFSIKNPALSHQVNVNGTFNLLEHCRRFGVKRFVFSSSSSVYGMQARLPLVEKMEPHPISPYALQKLAGEQYCRLYHTVYGLETICLRYFNIFGPRQNPAGDYAGLIPKFIRLISENTPPTIYGDGEQSRDFTYVTAAVEANLRALETQKSAAFGEAFNVGAGQNRSVNEVTQKLFKLAGKNPAVIYAPAVLEPRTSLADVSKIQKRLGWKAPVSFEEGLKKTCEYFASNGTAEEKPPARLRYAHLDSRKS
ncbi:MAG: NAD-dependent epimerase/dehydratase family protein [candidate division Zixibacteria bacterium]|nr:NAD-dependent epimerase/dehydratase family protein [candidate division Zixibacteria bacterium]